MALLNFNAAQHDALLPEGWYYGYVDDWEVKYKDAATWHLRVTFRIMEPDRHLRIYFHLGSRSPRFMAQAQKRFNELERAAGVIGRTQDPSVLRGQPVRVRVIRKAATPTFPAHNDIAEYTTVNAGNAGARP